MKSSEMKIGMKVSSIINKRHIWTVKKIKRGGWADVELNGHLFTCRCTSLMPAELITQ